MVKEVQSICLLLFAHYFKSTSLFNIDYEYTILKNGATDSLFGFSVTGHQVGSKPWMVVGAPRGNSSFLKGKDAQFSGAVYRCDPRDISTSCAVEVKFDEERNDGAESKSNQWLGVSLKSGGIDESIMTCAHRYKYHGSNKNYRLFEGKCWTVSEDFVGNGFYQPCRTDNSDTSQTPTHETYGQCEAGIGLDIIPKVGGGFTSYVIGAAGAKKFGGAIFDMNDDDQVIKADAAQHDDSYFGYAVAHGHFYSKTVRSVAVGGPRFKSYGKVLIYKRKLSDVLQEIPVTPDEIQLASGYGIALCALDANNDGLDELVVGAPFHSFAKNSPNQGKIYIYSKSKGNKSLTLTKTLDAVKVGTNYAISSNFGYSVANAGDLNLDGYQDLVVGSPHDDSGMGAIYIYQGSNVGVTEKPTQVVKASAIHSGLNDNLGLKGFGRSLGTGFDLDSNGYNDLVVGAYASDQAVLLRSRPVVNTEMSVAFTPKELQVQKDCSVRGGMTTCFNMSFCFNFSEPSKKIYTKPSDSILIKYTIKADPIKRPRVRFSSGLNTHETVEVTAKKTRCINLEGLYLVFNDDGSIAVYPDIVFEVTYSLPYGIAGLPKPKRSNTQVVNLDLYPALRESFKGGVEIKSKHKLNYQLKFERECTTCIPDLMLTTKSNQTVGYGQSTFKFNITLKNNGSDPAYSVGLRFNLTNEISLDYIILPDKKDIVCPNGICEDLFNQFSKGEEVVLHVILNTKKFKPESDNTINVTVTSVNNELPNTLNDNSAVITFDIKVEADVELLQGKSTQQVLYTGKVKGETATKTLNDIGPLVNHRYIVRNNGPDQLPTARLTIHWPVETLSGKHLLYLYQVSKTSLRTDCTVPKKYLDILGLLPGKGSGAINAKYQARTTDLTAEEKSLRSRRSVNATHSTAAPFVPPMKSSTTPPGSTVPPVMSNLTTTPLPETTQTPKKKRRKDGTILDCTTAKCIPIVCTFKDLDSGANEAVTIQSRLWQSSLLIDYYGEVLTVLSEADLDTGKNLTYIVDPNPNNNMQELYTNINPDFPPKEKEKKIWVYIIAALAGVLLLALLIFALYKLGFFKRKRYDNKYGVRDDKAKKALLRDK